MADHIKPYTQMITMKNPLRAAHTVLATPITVVALIIMAALTGCSADSLQPDPPTIEPAQPAVSAPVTTPPHGDIRPLATSPHTQAQTALFDHHTASLIVFAASTDPHTPAALTVLAPDQPNQRRITLTPDATAITGDDHGTLYVSRRGGYTEINIATGQMTPVTITDADTVTFTAIAQRADGNLVLGSADGAVFTLNSPTTVAQKTTIFAHVDAIVTEGDTAVVLDRAQTSVTALTSSGTAQQALRAGQGATTVAVDPTGRVLVADTRGEQLLIFSADPLIERQAYPVPAAPYGITGSHHLVWVSQTATNQVIGYEVTTGIPVEKVRYPTVHQPNSLAFDNDRGTLYVVSGSGAGVQIITHAAMSQ